MSSIFASKEIESKAYIIGGLALLLIIIQVINMLTGNYLVVFGIYPRELYGLSGIILSPFLHASFQHLFSNLLAFVVMGGFIIWESIEKFYKVSIYIILFSGSMVWGFGPEHTTIIGASGVVFGYLGYLISRAIIHKDQTSIMIALGIGLFYGGMIFGIFPGTPGVSWQSHLAGLLGGIAASYLLR